MRIKFSILDLLKATTGIAFVCWGIVTFDVGFNDVSAVLYQLTSPTKQGMWPDIPVGTSGRAVLLGIAMGTAAIVAVSHWTQRLILLK